MFRLVSANFSVVIGLSLQELKVDGEDIWVALFFFLFVSDGCSSCAGDLLSSVRGGNLATICFSLAAPTERQSCQTAWHRFLHIDLSLIHRSGFPSSSSFSFFSSSFSSFFSLSCSLAPSSASSTCFVSWLDSSRFFWDSFCLIWSYFSVI